MKLSGKNALVTGSTSGIGLAIAEVLAKNGANVMLNGFGDTESINTIISKWTEVYSGQFIYNAANLLHKEQIAEMIADAEKKFSGHIDILVNNAGIQFVSPVEDFPDEKFEQVIALNLTAAFYTTKAVLKGMKLANWGRIVNIASAHDPVLERASPDKCAYVAAKHGLIGLTKTVALETSTTGVTCNAICPGWVNTPLVNKQIMDRSHKNGTSIEEETDALVGEKHPSKKFVEPEAIGEFVLFLCSDAAAEIRGQDLSIDGGWTAR